MSKLAPPSLFEYINLMAVAIPIEWDRFTEEGGDYNIYGWIQRSDGQRDFVLLMLDRKDDKIKGGFVTSSAKYSAAICQFMFNEEGDHEPCKKIVELP